MSSHPQNDTWKKQNKKLVPATHKRAMIVTVNAAARTANVAFMESPQTVIRGIPLASHISTSAVVPGMQARVDTFSEDKPNSMVVSYIIGQQGSVLQAVSATILTNTSPVPSSSAAAGTAGQVAWDASHF